jgi:hypothetical protein
MTVQATPYPVTFISGVPQPLTLTPPFKSFTISRWILVTNNTPFTAILTGTNDDGVNAVSLAPGVTNKYQFSNVRGGIKVSWSQISTITTATLTQPNLVVDYSDNPDGSDFAGTYPAAVLPPQQTSNLISGAGAAGTGVFVFEETCPTGLTFLTIGESGDTLQLWNWGDTYPNGFPDNAYSIYRVALTVSNGSEAFVLYAQDSYPFPLESCSNRLAGLIVVGGGLTMAVNNPTGFDLPIFVTYSSLSPS